MRECLRRNVPRAMQDTGQFKSHTTPLDGVSRATLGELLSCEWNACCELR